MEMVSATMNAKGDFMTKEEFDAMVEADEARLGVSSEEFLQRHNEIMRQIDSLMEKGAKVNVKADHECKRRCCSVGSE